ncbi:MAG: metalloregulator ArsR/SmtB family transcription factor, partial [Aestuariivirga sp.]
MDELLAGLKAVAEITRLRILFGLSHGEMNVTELTQILEQSQPRVSRHLKLMTEAGL